MVSYAFRGDGEIKHRMLHDRGSDGPEREAAGGECAAHSRARSDEESLQQYLSHDVELRAQRRTTTAGSPASVRSDADEDRGREQ